MTLRTPCAVATTRSGAALARGTVWLTTVIPILDHETCKQRHARMPALTKYGPKGTASLSLGDPCPLCGTRFATGDFTTLLRTTARGKYADDGVEVHWDCVAQRWPRGTSR